MKHKKVPSLVRCSWRETRIHTNLSEKTKLRRPLTIERRQTFVSLTRTYFFRFLFDFVLCSSPSTLSDTPVRNACNNFEDDCVCWCKHIYPRNTNKKTPRTNHTVHRRSYTDRRSHPEREGEVERENEEKINMLNCARQHMSLIRRALHAIHCINSFTFCSLLPSYRSPGRICFYFGCSFYETRRKMLYVCEIAQTHLYWRQMVFQFLFMRSSHIDHSDLNAMHPNLFSVHAATKYISFCSLFFIFTLHTRSQAPEACYENSKLAAFSVLFLVFDHNSFIYSYVFDEGFWLWCHQFYDVPADSLGTGSGFVSIELQYYIVRWRRPNRVVWRKIRRKLRQLTVRHSIDWMCKCNKCHLTIQEPLNCI